MEDFTQEQIDLIKKTCVPANADPEHIKLFLYYAAKYGLDPLTKEIVLEIRTSKHGDKSRDYYYPRWISQSIYERPLL